MPEHVDLQIMWGSPAWFIYTISNRRRRHLTSCTAACFAAQRGFHATSPAWKDVTIAVPSMGDSITEGTVASVEKKEGERRCSGPPCVRPRLR